MCLFPPLSWGSWRGSLVDKPEEAKWLNDEERRWLVTALDREHQAKQGHKHPTVMTVMFNGQVWMLCLIYFGFIYGLYALGFFLPTIINGFQQQFGVTFNVFDKGLITAVPYLPAAIALYFWSKDASKRGIRSWHITIPAVAGAVSVPLALYMESPTAVIAVITITACAIFSALPNFWTLPTRFLTGAAAAAAVALINTIGNIAGFSAGYITGALRDASGSYAMPMYVVGGFMLLSAVLMVLLQRYGSMSAPVETKHTLLPEEN